MTHIQIDNQGTQDFQASPKITATVKHAGGARVWIILVLAFAASLIYWPSVVVLYGAWTDFQNLGSTHGFLVAAAAIALLFYKREELAELPAHQSLTAAVLLFASSAVWMVCYRAAIQDLHVTIFPALIGLAVATAFGWPVAWRMLVPLGLVYTAIPAWGEVSEPLQLLTVRAVRVLMWLTETPGSASGDTITIPQGTFSIEGGCSGMHYLVVGIAIALVQGELRRASLRSRAILVALMIALALVANWVRVFVIVVAGYMSGMQSSLLREHYWFGWELFAGALVVFFWIAGKLRDDDESVATAAATTGTTCGVSRTGVIVAIAALLAVPTISVLAKSVSGGPAATTVTLATAATVAWQSDPTPISDWKPVFPGADASARVTYHPSAVEPVEAFAALYRTQHQGAELVGYASSVSGAGAPAPLEERAVQSRSGEMLELRMRDGSGAQSLLWFQYRIGTRAFVTPLAAQLWYGAAAVMSDPVSLVFALRARCEPDCGAARDTLQRVADATQVRVIAADHAAVTAVTRGPGT